MSHVTIPPPPRRWVPRGNADEAEARALADVLGLPLPLCRLLAGRGFDEAGARLFLRPRLDQLGDPFRLAGMTEAVERIETAIARGETILVHGDYDVDGICTTALYTRVLRALGARVVPFVPHRMTDGYDLGPAGIDAAREAGATLILTGDCGVVAHEAIAIAGRHGIDVIVTDHHTPGETLPEAVAVVNPNRPDCLYPHKTLAGVGVAFKLCQALHRSRGVDEEPLLFHLDLVAVATIADLARLEGENRVLVRYGLRVLAQTRNPGLRALMRRAGVGKDGAPISAGQVSHVLAPRINAVGRMDEAAWGVRLLLTDDPVEADRIAERLETENRTRQAVDRQTFDEAMAILERDFDPARDYGVVLAAEGWHPGVIGIVASRVVERIHRPVVLVALDPEGGSSRGSARSIRGFDLYQAIHHCAGHLERYGGHPMAAGLDIHAERVDAFREAFNRYARGILTPEDLVAQVDIDLELRLPEANRKLFDLLQHFGPFGVGNPTPVLAARDVALAGPMRVVGDGHLKLDLEQDGVRLPAIGFRMADRIPELNRAGGRVDVAFQLQENHWNGRTELQARLVDIRQAGGES